MTSATATWRFFRRKRARQNRRWRFVWARRSNTRLSKLRRPNRHGTALPASFLARAGFNREEPMLRARFRPQAGDGGRGAGRAESEAGRLLRRRHNRWGWTRGSHFGGEFGEGVVVWGRSRWRRR